MGVRIINHGRTYNLTNKKFLCGCGCYFEADETAYFRDDSFTVPRCACHCPECTNVALEVLPNTILYK